jgi:hypothetical protein
MQRSCKLYLLKNLLLYIFVTFSFSLCSSHFSFLKHFYFSSPHFFTSASPAPSPLISTAPWNATAAWNATAHTSLSPSLFTYQPSPSQCRSTSTRPPAIRSKHHHPPFFQALLPCLPPPQACSLAMTYLPTSAGLWPCSALSLSLCSNFSYI